MKICAKCKLEKSLDDFHWRNKSKGKKSPYCKKCKQTIESEHYHTNPNRKNQIRNQKLKKQKVNYAIINEAKKGGCPDCGEKNPIVLEFDHLRDKDSDISRLTDANTDRLVKEIAKCEVVCANCHRIRTHFRRLSS